MDKKAALRKLLDAYHDLAVAPDMPTAQPQDGQGGPGMPPLPGQQPPMPGQPMTQSPQPLPQPLPQPVPPMQSPQPMPNPLPQPQMGSVPFPMAAGGAGRPTAPMNPQMAPTGGLPKPQMGTPHPGVASMIANTARGGVSAAGEMGGNMINAMRSMLPGSSERRGVKSDMYRDIVKKTRGYDNAPDMGPDGLLSEAGKMRRMKDMIRRSSRTGDFSVTDSLIEPVRK